MAVSTHSEERVHGTVTDARSWVLRMPLPSAHVVGRESHIFLIGVHLLTDTGQSGSGFAFIVENYGAMAAKSMLDDVVLPELGRCRASDVARLWHRVAGATHRIGRGISSLALSAVDTALWDLAARERGVSLADHIGRVRDSVPAYASGQFSPTLGVDELVTIAAGEVERGLRAIKIRVGLDLRADLERVKALREALGPGIRLLCDANERLSLPDAIWLGRHLEQYDVYWLEEPLPAHDVAAHASLAGSIGIPIAVGEHLQSVSDFMTFVRAGAAHIFQPDVGQLAGITEFLRIANVVREHGYSLAPHFLPELHIHLVAAYPNAIYLEQFPWADRWLKTPLVYADGQAKVPDTVGHGIEFTDEAWATFLVAGERGA